MAIGAMIPAMLWLVLIPLMVWEAVWKAVGLWKSARNNQLVWFICIAVFNTVGILPIVYIVFFQKKDGVVAHKIAAAAKGKSKKR